MKDPDPAWWQTITDAAGATPTRLQAAERLLQEVEPAPLDPQQIERMVGGLAVRPAPKTRRQGRTKAIAIGSLLLAVSWLAAVAPTAKWAERTSTNRDLDVPAAMQRAACDPSEDRRLIAVRVLHDVRRAAMVAMAQSARSPDAWLATATIAIRNASFGSAAPPGLRAMASIPITRSAAALTNRHLPVELRLPALIHVGVTAGVCWAGMRAAPLVDARASATRDRWLRQALPAR
ncbi:MAG: hypothetical protein MUC36_12770 [Planctomycetes bacterium]|jgi:hypothetical protein|nr:hypothetical protein [Planctomycetota bacterium]